MWDCLFAFLTARDTECHMNLSAGKDLLKLFFSFFPVNIMTHHSLVASGYKTNGLRS